MIFVCPPTAEWPCKTSLFIIAAFLIDAFVTTASVTVIAAVALKQHPLVQSVMKKIEEVTNVPQD